MAQKLGTPRFSPLLAVMSPDPVSEVFTLKPTARLLAFGGGFLGGLLAAQGSYRDESVQSDEAAWRWHVWLRTQGHQPVHRRSGAYWPEGARCPTAAARGDGHMPAARSIAAAVIAP